MSRYAVLAAASVCFLAACSVSSRDPQPTPPQFSTTPESASSATAIATAVDLRCVEAIETVQEPQDGYEGVLGVVALPTASVTQAIPTSRNDGPPVRYFAKRGLMVGAGSFSLAVVGESDLDGAIGWGSSGRFGRVLNVRNCNRDSSTWQAYAGGFETAKPGCLTIRVSTATRTKDVKVGVGAPCPGQKPPPQPSDT